MKTNITISVDVNNLLYAKNKVFNISDYLNQCLKSLNETIDLEKESSEEELIKLNNTINDAKVKKSILEMELKRKDELEEERKVLKEEFKRWECPICMHINFMEDLRCGGCTLPARNDSETKIIYIDEVLK